MADQTAEGRVTKVKLEQMTSEEARQAFARRPVVLLPVGSHETHGPQSPMGDFMVAAKVAELIAQRATAAGTETLVAPVLPFGGANFFGASPGGIALSQTTLRLVLAEMVENLLRHNVNRLVFFNGHNGNVEPIRDVTQDVYRSRRIMIPSYYFWRPLGPIIRRELGADVGARSHGHGANPVTAIHMHLWPELIRRDLMPEPTEPPTVLGLKTSGFGLVRFEGVDFDVPTEIDEIAPNGVWNCDPRLATPELGAVLVEYLVDLGAKFLAHFAKETA